jgi:GxxExxY protein
MKKFHPLALGAENSRDLCWRLDCLSTDMQSEQLNDLSYRIIGAGIEVHRTIGPGLLESTYRTCMLFELRERGMSVESERTIPVRYKSLTLDSNYRIDFLVDDTIIVELKSVETVLPVHHAQVLSYLRHAKKPLGLLMNFNVAVLADGVERIKNGY